MPPLCSALSFRWRRRSSAFPRTRTLKTLKWASHQPLVPLRSFVSSRKRVFADPQLSLKTAELQTLAREVQELLQTKIGTTAYSQVHNTIRQKAATRRQERKQILAQQVRSPACSLLSCRGFGRYL